MTIVGLGESLWDLLPGGKQLGGAPLNVACHAQQLLQGRDGGGAVATRVGADPLGKEIIAELVSRGLSDEFVQQDASHPTGTVRVELQAGQPQYTFVDDVAWDHLEFSPAWAELAARATAVCFGTLAQRAAPSREVIGQFVDAARGAVRLFDVNLRQHYFNSEVLDESCRRATLLKLNEQELPVLAKLLALPAGAPVFQLAQLRGRYDLDAVVYTRGRRGTMIVSKDKVISPPAVSYPTAADADSVGAGDACTAGVLVGWALGLPSVRIAELANHLGAFVAGQPGATPRLPPEILQMVAK